MAGFEPFVPQDVGRRGLGWPLCPGHQVFGHLSERHRVLGHQAPPRSAAPSCARAGPSLGPMCPGNRRLRRQAETRSTSVAGSLLGSRRRPRVPREVGRRAGRPWSGTPPPARRHRARPPGNCAVEVELVLSSKHPGIGVPEHDSIQPAPTARRACRRNSVPGLRRPPPGTGLGPTASPSRRRNTTWSRPTPPLGTTSRRNRRPRGRRTASAPTGGARLRPTPRRPEGPVIRAIRPLPPRSSGRAGPDQLALYPRGQVGGRGNEGTTPLVPTLYGRRPRPQSVASPRLSPQASPVASVAVKGVAGAGRIHHLGARRRRHTAAPAHRRPELPATPRVITMLPYSAGATGRRARPVPFLGALAVRASASDAVGTITSTSRTTLRQRDGWRGVEHGQSPYLLATVSARAATRGRDFQRDDTTSASAMNPAKASTSPVRAGSARHPQ